MFRGVKSLVCSDGFVPLSVAVERFYQTGFMMLHESNVNPDSYDSSDVCDNFRIDKLGGGISRFDAAIRAKDISEHASRGSSSASPGSSSIDDGVRLDSD